MFVGASSLVQIEIHVTQLQRSKLFYEHVFGWKPVPAEIHNYVVLDVPQNCPWGISLVPTVHSAKASNLLILYFEVQNGEEIAKAAVEYGGTKKFGPTVFPAYGSIWQITDPDGNRFGLFEKVKKD